MSNKYSRNIYQNEIVKPTDIYRNLHNKTHFKAANTIYLGIDGSLRDDDKVIENVLNEFSVKR